MKTLTQERLKEVLSYDPDTGEFNWREWRNGLKFGAKPGSRVRGYQTICIDGRIYKGHRLAWLYVYGCWPAGWLDHKNGVRGDDRIANLREATPVQNALNRRHRSTSKSPFKGASFHKLSGKWQAAITRPGGPKQHLGLFTTAEQAHAAYCEAAESLHGEFARFT